MFKSAATKIAHNSTLPALAGNKELRPLQDLIASEKIAMTAMQNFSLDFAKSAEALRAWAVGEGDDLGDTLTHCSTLLLSFTAALSSCASSHTPIRAAMKSIRTAEEDLEEMKRRRKALHSKADAAERKLSKMNPEHKGLPAQTELLNRLREEIRGVETDIVEGESRLGDDKRRAVKTWMGIKWGGLGELCEKGLIAAEYGRSIIAEIPEAVTPPGMPRVAYYAHQKTQSLVAEAMRGIEGVGSFGGQRTLPQRANTMDSVNLPINPNANSNLPPIPLVYNNEEQEMHTSPQKVMSPEYSNNHPPEPFSKDYSPYPSPPGGAFGSNIPPNPSHFSSYQQTVPQSVESSPYQPYQKPLDPQFHPGLPQHQPPSPSYKNVTSPSYKDVSSPSFLAESNIGPSLGSGHFMDASEFSTNSVDTVDTSNTNSTVTSPSSAPPPPPPPPGGQSFGRSVDDLGVTGPGSSVSQVPHASGGRFATFPVKSRTGGGSLSVSAPRPGAPDSPTHVKDASSLVNPWEVHPEPSLARKGSERSFGLAYDGLGDDGDSRETNHGGRPFERQPRGGYEEHSDSEGSGKHVRFGEVSDVEEELEKRYQLQQEHSQQYPREIEGLPSPPDTARPIGLSPTTPTPGSYVAAPHAPVQASESLPPSASTQPPRANALPHTPLDPQEEERQRNAAAAREISREMDSLTFAPPSGLPPPPQYDSPSPRGRSGSFNREASPLGRKPPPQLDEAPMRSRSGSVNREMSPLIPPAPAFAARSRSVSPLPRKPSLAEVNIPAQQQPAQVSPVATSPKSFARERVSPTAGPRSSSPTMSTAAYVAGPPTLAVRDDSFGDAGGRASSPMSMSYATPPEYNSPRLGARTVSGSVSSGGPGPSPLPSPVPGTKTISAAAFRRPPPRGASGDSLSFVGGLGGHTMPSLTDTSPLVLKKRLPTSPHPPPRGSPMGTSAGQDNGLAAPGQGSMRSVSGPGSLQNPHPPEPAHGAGEGAYGDEDGYDYISAYVNNSDDAGATQTESGPNAREGYGRGRFTTDLESEGLR